MPHVYGDSLSQQNAHWLLSKILCYLTHLQALGKVDRVAGRARAVGCIITGCASIRSSPRAAPVFSFEFFPPKTAEGERNLYAALAELRTLEPSFVSVTYGAGGSTREKTIEIVKRIREQYGLEAMAHFTCVGATVAELRETLDEMRQAGIDNVLALRGDPPAGEEAWVKTEGGLEYSRELVELISGGLPVRDRRRVLPRDAHPRREPRGRPRAPRREGRGRRGLPDHAAVLRQRRATSTSSSARARPEWRCRSSRASCRSRGSARSSGMAAMCGASIPDGLRRELHARGEDPEAVLDFGVAYATLQCAELLAAGAPGIHFYTLNRSPATRAILSALKLAKPWEKAVYPSSISSPSATRGEPSAAS